MAGKLQIVIVTPEKTMLDQQAELVVLPLADGEAGFMPGAAPMIAVSYTHLTLPTIYSV